MNKKPILVIFLFVLLLTLSSCTTEEPNDIFSSDFYYADVLLRNQEYMDFNVPLVTNFEISTIGSVSLESSLSVEFSYEIGLIENYKNYYSYIIKLSINPHSIDFLDDKELLIDKIALTMNDKQFIYNFGSIRITNDLAYSNTDIVTILGQGIYYPNFSTINLDLQANTQIEITQIHLSNEFILTNTASMIKEYTINDHIGLNLYIDTTSINMNKCYEFDIVIYLTSSETSYIIGGISPFKSQIDVLNRNLIDSLEA